METVSCPPLRLTLTCHHTHSHARTGVEELFLPNPSQLCAEVGLCPLALSPPCPQPASGPKHMYPETRRQSLIVCLANSPANSSPLRIKPVTLFLLEGSAMTEARHFVYLPLFILQGTRWNVPIVTEYLPRKWLSIARREGPLGARGIDVQFKLIFDPLCLWTKYKIQKISNFRNVVFLDPLCV